MTAHSLQSSASAHPYDEKAPPPAPRRTAWLDWLDATDPGQLRLRIAIIYQELSLSPNLTVAENIYLGREVHRGPTDERCRQKKRRDVEAQPGDPGRVACKLADCPEGNEGQRAGEYLSQNVNEYPLTALLIASP